MHARSRRTPSCGGAHGEHQALHGGLAAAPARVADEAQHLQLRQCPIESKRQLACRHLHATIPTCLEHVYHIRNTSMDAGMTHHTMAPEGGRAHRSLNPIRFLVCSQDGYAGLECLHPNGKTCRESGAPPLRAPLQVPQWCRSCAQHLAV